jgi:Flp pilus assembly protein TadG
MRVREFGVARLHDEERGAVLAIVAISLLVLLGMMVLTFDLGRGVALKRNGVNAADAGALAAARECGLGHGEASAMNAADELVAQNNTDAQVTGFELAPGAQCGPGSTSAPDGKNEVTVTVSVPQDYVFAPIFGFDNGNVVASATAEWTAGVVNSMPLMFDMSWMEGVCEAPGFFEELPDGATEPQCEFLWDNDGGPNGGLGEFTWGWSNLNEWDVEPGHQCTGAGGAGVGKPGGLKKYVRDGYPDFLSVNFPDPTYVCSMSGLVEDAWHELDMREGDLLIFPLVDPAGQIPPRPGAPDKYDVVDFIVLRVLDVNKLSESPPRTCGSQVAKNASGVCVTMSWPGLDVQPSNSGGRPIVRLID